MNKKPFLCRIGWHRWREWWGPEKTIVGYDLKRRRQCRRCNLVQEFGKGVYRNYWFDDNWYMAKNEIKVVGDVYNFVAKTER